jgi:2-isopropylmalate synthase
MNRKKIKIYDCTLREGAQASGISFSLQDKLRITHLADDMGFTYTEGGWPSSNVKDALYFEKLRTIKLKHTKVVPFGRTKLTGVKAEDDTSLTALVRTGLECGHIFGKGWDLHVRTVLRTTPEENLEAIYESIRFLKKHLGEVSFGFEHFFNAYKSDPVAALKVISTAVEAGIDWIDLADTNGGSVPEEIGAAVASVTRQFGIEFAVHCHNDTGCAIANTIAAVQNGATIVEGTINGYSERCGIADLCTVIPNLQIKLGYQCIPDDKLKHLTRLSVEVADLLQADVPKFHPYVGQFAFTHKAGVHVDAFLKHPQTYEHIDPVLVGNTSNVALSEVSGKSNLKYFLRKHGLDWHVTDTELQRLVSLVKTLELNGFEFNTAEESLVLLILKQTGKFTPKIRIARQTLTVSAEPGETIDLVDEGSGTLGLGPTGAMLDTCAIELDADIAFFTAQGVRSERLTLVLRGEEACFAHLISGVIEACARVFPELKGTALTDYKIRTVHSSSYRTQRVRVVVELSDGSRSWRMTGIGKTLSSAAVSATVDALQYRLHMDSLGAVPQAALHSARLVPLAARAGVVP